jgi:hypothetical protein
MKSKQWKTYRTRFLVKAKQLSASLSFVDPLGRQHSGRKGDYLVESSDGVISIAPRQIFEDIYVAMSSSEKTLSENTDQNSNDNNNNNSPFSPNILARLGPSSEKTTARTTGNQAQRGLNFTARKLPHGCRDRRPNSNLGYM